MNKIAFALLFGFIFSFSLLAVPCLSSALDKPVVMLFNVENSRGVLSSKSRLVKIAQSKISEILIQDFNLTIRDNPVAAVEANDKVGLAKIARVQIATWPFFMKRLL